MKKLNIADQDNKLEKRVQSIINSYAKDYKSGVIGFIEDFQISGCQGGMIRELIYYHDTTKWFNRYKNEINSLLFNQLEQTGLSIKELFDDKWDNYDPLVLETPNKNLLAWFSFEKTAFNLTRRAGLNI